jgi:hypothetical protein
MYKKDVMGIGLFTWSLPYRTRGLEDLSSTMRCCRITTLCLLNYTRARADEHGSYKRSIVHLTLVEPGLTEVGVSGDHTVVTCS